MKVDVGYKFRMSQAGPQCTVEKIRGKMIYFTASLGVNTLMTGNLNSNCVKMYDIKKADAA